MTYPLLHRFPFGVGFNASLQRLTDEAAVVSAEGSSNTLILGDGYRRPVRAPETFGAGTGSRIMCPIGRTWGGLKDNSGDAVGSVFEDIGRSLWGIGKGQVHIAGVDVSGFTLSTLLKVVLLSSGTYGSPYTAGLSQPSAPDVAVTSSAGDVTGAVSFKLERRRNATGAPSVASPTSAVVTPTNGRVRVTFPLASAGQDYWRVFVTMMGFGGTGIHYALPYSNSIDISEVTVAAGTVDGISRSLEFNWKDGDLVPIEASYDDYAPPAGTHAIRLENVMNVVGCYADATVSPTTSSPGTAIAVSKPNAYESYVPTHLLYLPEPVIDVLSRPIDSYGFIGCENSIHAIQYVGYRGDDLPACTITTVLPDIGIKYPHNWYQFRGRLAVYTAEGNLLIMSEDGEMDTTLVAPVKRLIENWLPEDTVLAYDPFNDALMLMNGLTVLSFSLQRGAWGDPIYLQDYGLSGSVMAAQASQRRVYMTINDGGGTLSAYEWDKTVQPVQIAQVSHFITQPDSGSAKNICELSIALENGVPDAPIVAVIGRNQQKIAYRRCSGAKGVPRLFNYTDLDFNSGMNNKKFVAFGTDLGGPGIHYLAGIISNVLSPDEAAIVDFNDTPISFPDDYNQILVFVGDWLGTATMSRNVQHVQNFWPRVAEAKSYALALWTYTDGRLGAFTEAQVFGFTSAAGRIRA